MALTVGSKAPDFTLKGRVDGKFVDYRLSDNFGKHKTVLLFFPAAFSSVCTDEFCTLTGGLDAYTSLDADVVAVSVDNALSQEAWAQREKIAVRLLSDLKHEVTKMYDVVWPDFAGLGPVAARSAFVIDKDGTILYSEQTASLGEMPDFEAVRAAAS